MINEIRLGSSGKDVEKLYDFFGIPSKTVCDKKLEKLIKSFQKIKGLQVDGIFGFESWKKHYEVSRGNNPEIQDSDYTVFSEFLDCDPYILKALVNTESKENIENHFGILNIPGDKYLECGITTFDKFLEEIRKGEFYQLSLGISYLKNIGMGYYLRNLDFQNIAYKLKGPEFSRNLYDFILKRAYYSAKRGK